MDKPEVTWIVAADGAEARVFEERARTGPVRELPKLRMKLSEEDGATERHQRATVHQRFGEGRHAADESAPPHDEIEARFMRRIATRLGISASQGEFQRLVLMAPPRALGHLRKALAAPVAARVEAADHHERVHDDADEIRRHLRSVRARA